jgi:membrane peptidoglycan carboxypeptidase
MFEDPRRLPSIKRSIVYLRLDLDQLLAARSYHWGEKFSEFEQIVIVLEDHRYLKHHGIDWLSVARVILKRPWWPDVGGASTIEMQYVRTITGRHERSFRRKAREMLLAWLLDFHMNKPDILASYLARAYFGTGIRGAEAAAKARFGLSLPEVTLEQAAEIASLLVYPAPRQPTERWQKRVIRRSRYGLALWRRLEKGIK